MSPPKASAMISKEKMKQMRLPFAPIQKENAITKQKEEQAKEIEKAAEEKQKRLEQERIAKEEELRLWAEEEAKKQRDDKDAGDEKENEAVIESLSKSDQGERKRKLSESSTKIASSNKKTNSTDTPNKCLEKKIAEKIKADQLSNNSTKIKIAVKPKKVKKDASDSNLRHDKTSEDEESDIFDDIDVSKMDVDQEVPSSRSASPNENILDITKTSVNVDFNAETKESNSNADLENPKKLSPPFTPKSFSDGGTINGKSTCSPVVLEDRKHKMKVEIAKLVVKINENKDLLDKSVERQDFLLAQEFKNTLATLEGEKQQLSSVLERGDAVELKSVLDQRNKVLSGTKLFSPHPSIPECDIKGTSETAESSKELDSKSPKMVCNNTKNSLPKKVSSKQLLSKAEQAKLKEEEKKMKELEKKRKDEMKEKERLEKIAQKEKERKEKEEQKEKEKQQKEAQKERERKEKELEKREKEQQKERERIEKLEQKQKERMEKERIKMAKEEEKVKKQLEKEIEKEELKKERELEKLKRDEEKERLKKEKEEKERLEKIEKEKEELKNIKPITSFFAKKTPQDNESVPENHNSGSRLAGSNQSLFGTNASDDQIDSKIRSCHLSQFLIKKNMRIAPLLRSCLIEANKMKLDNILKCSIWEEMQGTYLNLLKSKEYVPSSSGHTWPVKDIGKSQDTIDCDNECESQDNDEDDAEDQTVKSLLELDQSKIVEIDIPDDDIEAERKIMNVSSNGVNTVKPNNMFCKTKAKLLQFYENERPAYWGTWSKKSSVVGPRRPFAKDCHYLEYDYDSDDDWEEEEEGESLSDEEKDKEEDQEMKEEDDDDDGFFVGHGVLDKDEAHLIDSEDEDNSRECLKKEKVSSEKEKDKIEEDLEVQKMKMRAEQFEEAYKKQKHMPTKLKPRVFGCFWKSEFEDDSFSDENISKERIVHDQLMKILKPYGCVVMLTDAADNNTNDSTAPIDTSHTINIRVKPSPSSKLSDNAATPKVGDNLDTSSSLSSKKTPARPKAKVFPEDAVPHLIRLVHGNSHNKIFLVKEFSAFLQTNDKNGENKIEKESDEPSTKEDCDDESKELEVPKTKIVAKLQEIAEYKRWPDTGRMANKKCWIVKPEVLTDPKWKIDDLKDLEENGSSWNYILEQPKNVGPGRTPNVNEQSDKELGVKSNSASPSNTPKRKAEDSSIERVSDKRTKSPAPSLLITKFAKILTPEDRIKQMTKLREKAEAEREEANRQLQEKLAAITKELIEEKSIFNVGDLVWGTMKGFPSWPGKIVVPPDVPDLKRPAVKKLLHCIKFFGTYDYAWLAEQDVKPYLLFKESLSKGSKAQNFQRALKEIDEFSLGKKLIDSIKEPMDTSECGSPQLQIKNVTTEKE